MAKNQLNKTEQKQLILSIIADSLNSELFAESFDDTDLSEEEKQEIIDSFTIEQNKIIKRINLDFPLGAVVAEKVEFLLNNKSQVQ